MFIKQLAMLVTLLAFVGPVFGGSKTDSVPLGQEFSARDSLKSPADASRDAMECLNGLCWRSEAFTVRCTNADRAGIDALLRFPSARPTLVEQNDEVAIEWYAAKTTAGTIRNAPAVVVVHESGRGMTVGRMIARGLRDRGLHAFMVQLPFYGVRRPASTSVDEQSFAVVMQQGISDVRRARDAVAALPMVDTSQISLQGTSLGGFVSLMAAGLDAGFDSVFVLLAGGDLAQLIISGERETAQLRQRLESRGYTGDRLSELLNRFEPNRLAHRISHNRLWLFTATYDTTVPPVHADSFARAAGLSESHHIRMPATHYSGVIFLPMVLDQISGHAGGRQLLHSQVDATLHIP